MQRFGPDLAESELRARAFERMDAGALPIIASRNIRAGYGSSSPCAVCGLKIAPIQVEYDVTDPRTGKDLMFHLACHAVWQLECLQRLREQAMAEREATASSLTGRDPKRPLNEV